LIKSRQSSRPSRECLISPCSEELLLLPMSPIRPRSFRPTTTETPPSFLDYPLYRPPSEHRPTNAESLPYVGRSVYRNPSRLKAQQRPAVPCSLAFSTIASKAEDCRGDHSRPTYSHNGNPSSGIVIIPLTRVAAIPKERSPYTVSHKSRKPISQERP